MDLVPIPAGVLLRGSTTAQLNQLDAEQHLNRSWFEDETPTATVEVAPFAIGRYPVTNRQFAEFATVTGYVTEAEQRGFGLVYGAEFWEERPGASWRYPAGAAEPRWRWHEVPDHPAIHLCAADADAYATWAHLRLPTETEWEYAARGPSSFRTWPWGDRWASDACNCAEHWNDSSPITDAASWRQWWSTHHMRHRAPTTTRVGSHPDGASPFGVMDLAGNVLEWTGSLYRPYQPDHSYGALYDHIKERYRTARGGSWMHYRYQCRTAERFAGDQRYSSVQTGFRCAGSFDPTERIGS
ncbi:formylglycine-generating enzyme family protein [Streptomyces sp. NPDC018045]|uniref:formylglycine-generating enzyme family protein n=1 Tax=Streptomyces sp. NPDC018045 TaxID=3365037 RepID=UPI003792C890